MTTRRDRGSADTGLKEHENQRDDQTIDGDGFGKGDTENHVGAQFGRGFRVAAHRLKGTEHEQTDTDTTTDSSKANCDASTEIC